MIVVVLAAHAAAPVVVVHFLVHALAQKVNLPEDDQTVQLRRFQLAEVVARDAVLVAVLEVVATVEIKKYGMY